MKATMTEQTKVKVFAESPIWDSNKPWFSHPAHVLKSLLLAEYLVLDDRFADGVAEIRALHPDSVLLYVNP